VSDGLKCKIWAAVFQLGFSFGASIFRPNAKLHNVGRQFHITENQKKK